MGIKDFLKIAYKDFTIEELGEYLQPDRLIGETIVIDAFNYIYRNYFSKAKLSHDGKITSHIAITLKMVQMFRKLGVKQLWIFDTKAHELKKETQEKRTTKLPPGVIGEVKKLLALYGVNYKLVSCEAEMYGAHLVKSGFCRYVLTNDFDVLLGGGNMLRTIKEDKKEVYFLLQSNIILEKLEITYEELVKIGIIMGTDMGGGKTRGIGPRSVMNKFRDIKLTDRQLKGYDYLLEPIDPKASLVAEPNRLQPDKEKLKEWLREMGFGEKTLMSL